MGFEMSPQKNSFFLWLVLRNRVLVDASLQVRNIQLVSRCSLCEKEGDRCYIDFVLGVLQGFWNLFKNGLELRTVKVTLWCTFS
jgi:hypothetical protein